MQKTMQNVCMASNGKRQLLDELARGPTSAKNLQRVLGISQPTVSRLLRRVSREVVRLGRGRSTRYAHAAHLFGTDRTALPLFRVDRDGTVREIGSLHGLFGGAYYLGGADPEFWLLGCEGHGLHESLPYFLYDLRPAGFMGRQLARSLAAEWGFPPDPRSWDDTHIGQYLLRRGHDVPGCILLGEAAAQRANNHQYATVVSREREYPDRALRALRDEDVGSSAAGEQPKFTAFVEDAGHVIVKFSTNADTDESRRWRDLLLAEAHALRCVSDAGIAAATTTAYAFQDSVFLESRRFDRVGLRGRLPALSLTVIDLEFAGQPATWTAAARELHSQGLLDDASCSNVKWLETFGHWIGNTDMHHGNLSLTPEEGRFRLLPAYDMLPMCYVPRRGELPTVDLRPPIRLAGGDAIWHDTKAAARRFWQRIADDERVSLAFRRIARANAANL